MLPHHLLQTQKAEDRFCFIQFTHHDYMAEFIKKQKDTLVIAKTHEIVGWFLNPENIPDKYKEAYRLMQNLVSVPKSTSDESLTTIEKAY